MVSCKTILTAALVALPSAVSAYIYNMTGPSTAVAGSSISVTMRTSDYIENWQDYSIIFGLAPSYMECDPDVCIGTQIGFESLYPANPQPGEFNVDVTVPKATAAGDYWLVAAVPYLVGASGLTEVHAFNFSLAVTASS